MVLFSNLVDFGQTVRKTPFKIIGLQELMLDSLSIWLIIYNFWNEVTEKNFEKTLLWLKIYVILFPVLKNVGTH